MPEACEKNLPPERAALHLAIGLYTADEATLGQAAEAAGLSQSEFLRELGRRRIALRFEREDFLEDLATVRTLAR